jgi:hypothetical protein
MEPNLTFGDAGMTITANPALWLLLGAMFGFERQGAMRADLARWHTPVEALVMATSTNAELLKLSGPAIPVAAGMASWK